MAKKQKVDPRQLALDLEPVDTVRLPDGVDRAQRGRGRDSGRAGGNQGKNGRVSGAGGGENFSNPENTAKKVENPGEMTQNAAEMVEKSGVVEKTEVVENSGVVEKLEAVEKAEAANRAGVVENSEMVGSSGAVENAAQPAGNGSELMVDPQTGDVFGTTEAAIEKVQSLLDEQTQAGNTTPRQKRSENTTYIGVKAQVMREYEPNNYSKLYFVRSGEKWYKLFGNSALIFAYGVAPEINVRAKLRVDSDYHDRSESGVVSIANMDLIEKKMLEKGIQLSKASAGLREYNLGKSLTRMDIRAMKRESQLEWAKVNTILRVRDLFPDLYALLKDFPGKVYYTTRSFDAYARDTFGTPVLQRIADSIAEYNRMCNSDQIKPSDFFDKLIWDTDWESSRLSILAEMRLLTPKQTLDLLHHAAKIKREVERCRLRVE